MPCVVCESVADCCSLQCRVLFVNMSQIVAPYGGKLKRTGPREVAITVNEMNSVMVTISNVDLNVDEKEASLRNSDLLICISLISRKLNPIILVTRKVAM